MYARLKIKFRLVSDSRYNSEILESRGVVVFLFFFSLARNRNTRTLSRCENLHALRRQAAEKLAKATVTVFCITNNWRELSLSIPAVGC